MRSSIYSDSQSSTTVVGCLYFSICLCQQKHQTQLCSFSWRNTFQSSEMRHCRSVRTSQRLYLSLSILFAEKLLQYQLWRQNLISTWSKSRFKLGPISKQSLREGEPSLCEDASNRWLFPYRLGLLDGVVCNTSLCWPALQLVCPLPLHISLAADILESHHCISHRAHCQF